MMSPDGLCESKRIQNNTDKDKKRNEKKVGVEITPSPSSGGSVGLYKGCWKDILPRSR